MAPTRLIVSGSGGRMGRTLRSLAAADPGWEVVGGLDRNGVDHRDELPQLPPEAAADLLRGCDAVIDFSAPSFLTALLRSQGEALEGKALIVGTTGLGAEEEELIEEASGRGPVLVAANFSVGVNLLAALAEQAARVLDARFDVEIVETHHRRKEDAPSGTALALGEAVAAGRGIPLADARIDGRSGRPGARPTGEIGFHALRGGDVIGEHHVHFIGDLERIELTHRASDRTLFAAGALHAARWLVGRDPGRYTMRDVLGL